MNLSSSASSVNPDISQTTHLQPSIGKIHKDSGLLQQIKHQTIKFIRPQFLESRASESINFSQRSHLQIAYLTNDQAGKISTFRDNKVAKMEWVKLTITNKTNSNEEIYVSISNIAKVYGIKPDEVKKAAKEGKLPELLEGLAIQNDYLASHYSKQMKKEMNISEKKLALEIHELCQQKIFKQNPNEGNVSKETHNHIITVHKKNGKQEVFIANKSKILGKGGFGVVYKAKSITSNDNLAQKQELKPTNDKEIEHEYKLLDELHKNGQKRGIQHKPHLVTELSTEKKNSKNELETRQGYITHRYEGTLNNAENMSIEKRVKIAEDIFEGLNHLKEANIFHGDIKSDNIFVKKEDAYIGDFGGAIAYGKDSQGNIVLPENIYAITSSNHLSMISQNQIQKLSKQSYDLKDEINQHKEMTKNIGSMVTKESTEKLISLETKLANVNKELVQEWQKADDFAAGIVLYKLLTGKDCRTSYTDKYFVKTVAFNDSDFDPSVDEEMKLKIRTMLGLAEQQF